MSAKNGHYWLKLHFKDRRSSLPLMLCSMQARGVAIEAEILMQQSPKPGHLLMADGTPLDVATFARLVSGDFNDVKAGLDELVRNGEFNTDAKGTVVCPRLIEQGKQSERMRQVVNHRHRNTQRITQRDTPRNTHRSTQRNTKPLTRSDSDSDSDFGRGGTE